MKFLIIVVLFSSTFCSENIDKDGYKNEERRIAGGGNYGGFVGLTTYGAGPFLVEGKFERDNDSHEQADVNTESKTGQDRNYNAEYTRNFKEKENYDEYLEYLGYDGVPGYCIGKNKDKSGYYNDFRKRENMNSSNLFDDEIKRKCDSFFGFTGPTANDEPEKLLRPCALDDWQCIRKYFATNSNCKPAYGPISDPLYIDIITIFFPVANITAALPNLMVRGLSSAQIREFYVNKRSGNLVLALDVTNLNQTVPRAYFRYRRTAKESIVLADYATVNYRSVTLTAVIPIVPHLRLDLADIHADVHDATPVFFIGPGAFSSTDPDVIAAFTQFSFLLPFSIREGFLFQSKLFTSNYIQENICNFGLKLVSV